MFVLRLSIDAADSAAYIQPKSLNIQNYLVSNCKISILFVW